MNCLVDCDDGEVYNYHKDKCEYYDDTCGNLKEKDTCKTYSQIKWHKICKAPTGDPSINLFH